MNKGLAKEWIIALLSGEYAQGQGRLKSTNNEFCCLGVYCDLRVKKDVGRWNPDSGADIWYVDETGYSAGGALPPSVRAELEMSGEFESALIGMNDTDQSTFEEIAYAIAQYTDLLEFYNDHKA